MPRYKLEGGQTITVKDIHVEEFLIDNPDAELVEAISTSESSINEPKSSSIESTFTSNNIQNIKSESFDDGSSTSSIESTFNQSPNKSDSPPITADFMTETEETAEQVNMWTGTVDIQLVNNAVLLET